MMIYSRQIPLVCLLVSAASVASILGQQQPPQQQQPNSQVNQPQSQAPSTQQQQLMLERARLRQQASQQLDGNLEEIHHGHGPDWQAPSTNKDLWPVVNVDRHENRSKVDVHVPIFFDMSNQKDQENGRAKLDLSVLHGLVTVTKDKSRDQDGQLSGPVKVTVFGIPVYSSRGTPVSKPASTTGEPASSKSSSTAAAAALESRLESRVESIGERFRENFEKTNEKVMRSLSDILDRLSRRTSPGKVESPGNKNTPISIDQRLADNNNNNTRYNTIDTTTNSSSGGGGDQTGKASRPQ